MLDLFVKFFRPDFFARKLKGKKNTIILLYHSPTPKNFAQHVEYLSHYYNFISLQQLVDAILEDDWSSVPLNSLIFTFDDGHIANYELRDVFKRFKIIPTIYLCSGIVGTNCKFWWSKLCSNETEVLKLLTNKERIEILRERETMINNSNESPDALTNVQIREMLSFVDFQSHTKNHPIITMLDDDELAEELESPIYDLKKYGLDIKHFAYPNGDYSSREIKYLKKCNYSSARTTDIGWNNLKTDLYKMKIMGVSDNASISKLRLQVSGIFGWALHVFQCGNFTGKKKIILKNT